MQTTDEIKVAIRFALKEITGREDIGDDVVLVDPSIGILPVNFLYIFDLVERELSLPVHRVLDSHTYDVMTIENLSMAILQLSIVDE